jgi:hypothetical protein
MYVLRATNDRKFYEMAVDYLEAIERISKIKCGFATVIIYLVKLIVKFKILNFTGRISEFYKNIKHNIKIKCFKILGQKR